MKKIVMTAALAAFAFSGAMAQYPPGGAHNTTSTPDEAPISVSAILTDMFDLAPTAGQQGSTDFTANWAAWNDGQAINNINVVPGNTYYFLVSATRGFHLDIASTNLSDGSGPQIPASHIEWTFASNDGGAPNGNWDVAQSNAGRCATTQTNMCSTAFGGYDMRFTVDLRLDDEDGAGADLYSYNLSAGTYTGTVTVYGGLN